MARKKRKLRPGKLLFRIGKRAVCGPVLGPERNWPSWRRTRNWAKRKLRIGRLASFTRDPRTGAMDMKGMRPGTNGRLEFGRAQQTAKPGRSGSASRDRIEQRAAKRKAERARRTGRTPAARKPATATPVRNDREMLLDEAIGAALLGAKHVPRMMAGFTPQQQIDHRMTQLSCQWCKSTNARPITTGGAIRIVTGVLPCNHTPFPAPGMPFQEPLGPTGLICPGCENTGKSGGKACPTCQGFIVRWSEFGGIGAMPTGTPRIRKAPTRPTRRRKS